MQDEIDTYLQNLVHLSHLIDDDYNLMKPAGSKPDILYGLCKVHKEEIKEDGQRTAPLRPILSSIGAC